MTTLPNVLGRVNFFLSVPNISALLYRYTEALTPKPAAMFASLIQCMVLLGGAGGDQKEKDGRADLF